MDVGLSVEVGSGGWVDVEPAPEPEPEQQQQQPLLEPEPEPEPQPSGGGLLQRTISAFGDADAPPARIWVGSWNTAVAEVEDPDLVPGGRRTIHTFDQFVPPDCDVYIMGLQEGSPEHDGEYFFSQLTRYLRERHEVEQVALPAGQVDRIYGRGDGSFVLPKFTGMRVYCSSRWREHVAVVSTAGASAGINEGSKGAVRCSPRPPPPLTLQASSRVFVNAQPASPPFRRRRSAW